MNFFVADPHWGWWIILYFYLGGIAAGAYFMATLIELFGGEEDEGLARAGYLIAFPLISLCGLFLILDLDQPLRFWHMLLKSEVVEEAFRESWPWSGRSWRVMVHAPLLKYWSPMSVGSWALLLFGLCSSLSFVETVWPTFRLSRWLRRPVLRRTLQVVGCGVGFFVAAYTGSLLSATNQPIWSDSVWIAPLFLTSAASTGIAAIILMARYRKTASVGPLDRLENANLWALGLESVVLSVFLASLGALLVPMLGTWHGKVFVFGTLLLGLLVPLAVHLRVGGMGNPSDSLGIAGQRGALVAAGFALLGGFLLRYGLLTTPPELLARGPASQASFGPEERRPRGEATGADPGNRPTDLQPRSKVFTDE